MKAIILKGFGSIDNFEMADLPIPTIKKGQIRSKTKADKSKSIFIAGGAGGVGTFVIMIAKHSGLQNIITTAGNDKSLTYLIQNFQLKREQIIDYKDDNFINKVLERNGGYFDIAL